MANNATLTTLVQADIDALDGTQTLDYLTELKVAAVKLGMTTTAIDTRLDALDMSAADTATLMENAVANELALPVLPDILPKLAPDPTFMSRKASSSATIISGIDARGALTTCLSLTGKHVLGLVFIGGMSTGENIRLRMTIDGSEIFDETFTPPFSTMYILGVGTSFRDIVMCESSFLLEAQTISDANIDLYYDVRAIL